MTGLMWLDISLMGGLGLLIGSFLNVVIYRLPKMMEQQWATETEMLAGKELEPLSPGERFNLMVPRSRCQKCGHSITALENIPVLSFVFLRGKCSSCATPISIRYPLIELATSALFAWCAWRWQRGSNS